VQRVRMAITQAGASVEEIGRLDTHLRLPFPLGGAKVLGHAMLISGRNLADGDRRQAERRHGPAL